MKTLCVLTMKTIEELCKYKDVTDLVYRQVHALCIKELIDEYNEVSFKKFGTQGDNDPNSSDYEGQWYPPFFGCRNVQLVVAFPCFNWRLKEHQTDDCPIYHISFHNCTITPTTFMFKPAKSR